MVVRTAGVLADSGRFMASLNFTESSYHISADITQCVSQPMVGEPGSPLIFRETSELGEVPQQSQRGCSDAAALG